MPRAEEDVPLDEALADLAGMVLEVRDDLLALGSRVDLLRAGKMRADCNKDLWTADQNLREAWRSVMLAAVEAGLAGDKPDDLPGADNGCDPSLN